MYLLPGEMALFDQTEDWLTWAFHSTDDYDFPPSWEGEVPYVNCTRLCDRDKRPFECRTYPLFPYLDPAGELEMRFAPFARGVCPLADGVLTDLQPAFIAACQAAWTILLEDPLIREMVELESRQADAVADLPFTALEDDPE